MRNTLGKLNFLGSAPHNTVANATYERLKHDIIFGKLEPGAKLKLETLKDEYAASVSTLRETLNRLTSEGFVSGRRTARLFRESGIS